MPEGPGGACLCIRWEQLHVLMIKNLADGTDISWDKGLLEGGRTQRAIIWDFGSALCVSLPL